MGSGSPWRYARSCQISKRGTSAGMDIGKVIQGLGSIEIATQMALATTEADGQTALASTEVGVQTDVTPMDLASEGINKMAFLAVATDSKIVVEAVAVGGKALMSTASLLEDLITLHRMIT